MRVHSCAGYYSDFAAKVTGVPRPRDPPFWESYMFCWAVRSGEYKRSFYILESDGSRIDITQANFGVVRPNFGKRAAAAIAAFAEQNVQLVPVPDTDALVDAKTYRTLKMVEEAFKGTAYDGRTLDGLRWNTRRQRGHEGGSRKRDELLPLLVARPEVKGKNIVLVDDVFTTGGNLLACLDRLLDASATVIGAVTCGRSVYDTNDPPFGARQFDLTEQLQDYR